MPADAAATDADHLLDRALGALEAGRPAEAEALAHQGLALDAQHAALWSLAGLCARLRHDLPAAEAAWRQSLQHAPDPEVGRRLAALLVQQGRRDDAIACHQALATARPQDAGALVDLGVQLLDAERWDEAEHACRAALALRPDDVAAHSNLGLVLEATRRYAEAEVHQRRAQLLAPHQPAVLCHLANLLARTGRPEAAQALYQVAMALDPLGPAASMAQANLGVLHFDHDRLDEAEACFRAALALRPQAHTAHLNLAQSLLARGRFAEGWALWERRYALDVPGALPAFPRQPVAAQRWRGEPLAGRSLLVWPEQGHGDQVQFSRYLARLKTLGADRLTLACSAPLWPLLQGLAGPDAVIPLDEAPAALMTHALWAPLLGLPHHCDAPGHAPPSSTPYLHASAARIAQWRGRLPAPAPGGLRVGLVWRGFAWHDNDAHRSLPGLAPLAPLWQVPGVQFISLQKGAGEDEGAAPPPGQPLTHLGSELADFADTAALLAQLDLLITVDTAAAHVAGALGRPCWVLLPARRCDWRWLRGRDDTPWYGSLRLFRQAVPGDWGPAVAAVGQALHARQALQATASRPV